MQIKNKQSNYLLKPQIIVGIKLLILLGCVAFIYLRWREKSMDFTEIQLPDSFSSTLVIVVLLMIVNWSIEVLRWKISVGHIQPTSFGEAAEAVFGGLALNWLFPFTAGDLMARLARIQDKYQATAAAILNRVIMMFFTLAIGLFGLSRMADVNGINGWAFWLILLGVPLLVKIYRKHLNRFLVYFQSLKRDLLLTILSLSLLRYAVFVSQFYLLLHLFLPRLSADVLVAGIGWIFLIRSSLPLFFGGVGVREVSGLMFFQGYTASDYSIILPIFIIWVVNTVVPSLLGLVYLWKFRINIAK